MICILSPKFWFHIGWNNCDGRKISWNLISVLLLLSPCWKGKFTQNNKVCSTFIKHTRVGVNSMFSLVFVYDKIYIFWDKIYFVHADGSGIRCELQLENVTIYVPNLYFGTPKLYLFWCKFSATNLPFRFPFSMHIRTFGAW